MRMTPVSPLKRFSAVAIFRTNRRLSISIVIDFHLVKTGFAQAGFDVGPGKTTSLPAAVKLDYLVAFDQARLGGRWKREWTDKSRW